jgi:hypothetical protein
MVTKTDYGKREIEASRSVLVELIHILGEFKDSIVVVGGSVLPYLYPETANEYVGTLDVDLALDPRSIDNETYLTLREALLNRGYRENQDQPYIFYRDMLSNEGENITVQVDLLSCEYGGTGRKHRTQRIQGIRARKARGSDLAFEQYKEVEIEAELPDGGIDRVKVKISGIVPFIVMKGMALADRMKEKDSYDIYFCLTHHPQGLDDLISEFKPHIQNKLILEGLRKIADKFASPEYMGPTHVADFEEITDEEERDRIKRDAFERVRYLLEHLGIK